jgi:putative peptide zinc metalloprotease protein
VARLRPQLRPQVQVRQQSQRGTDWYLLVDPSVEEVRRINRNAYAFVGRCDGHNTVDQIWQALLQLHPEESHDAGRGLAPPGAVA